MNEGSRIKIKQNIKFFKIHSIIENFTKMRFCRVITVNSDFFEIYSNKHTHTCTKKKRNKSNSLKENIRIICVYMY